MSVSPQSKVIVVTGREERHCALEAVKMGAHDFYQKPVDADVLSLIVDRAYQLHELERENRRLSMGKTVSPLQGIIAASSEMEKVCHTPPINLGKYAEPRAPLVVECLDWKGDPFGVEVHLSREGAERVARTIERGITPPYQPACRVK